MSSRTPESVEIELSPERSLSDTLEPRNAQPFTVDLSRGGNFHGQVVDYEFLDRMMRLGPPVHSLGGEDLTGREEKGALQLFEPLLRVLFGSGDDYGRYSVVKELPYYHLSDYPVEADPESINRYIDRFMPKSREVYRDQELGDIDVGVLDRKTRTAHVTEVKTNGEYLGRAVDSVRKFGSYGEALGWEVEGEVVVFSEMQRQPEELVVEGYIERYRVPETQLSKDVHGS